MISKRTGKPVKRPRCTFDREFKLRAAQMLLDSYSARLASENLGIGNTNLFFLLESPSWWRQ